MMIKRILVGLDDTSYTETALKYALDIAKKFDSRITGIAVIDTEEIEDATAGAGIGSIHYAETLEKKMMAEAQEHTKNILDNFVSFCEDSNLSYTDIIETGIPFKVFLQDSKFHDILIVGKKTHFELPDNKAVGDTIVRLLKHETVPILAVNEAHEPVRNILIPVTESIQTSKVLQNFLQSDIFAGTKIFLLHCSDDEKNGQLLLHVVEDYVKAYGYNVEAFLREGKPEDEILSLSREKECELIVMASHERRHLSEFIFGSTTKHVINESESSLLLF